MTQSNPFGTDLWLGVVNGVLDVDVSMRETSGIYVLAQSCVMQQTTSPDSVFAAPGQCIDIRSFISKGMSITQIQQLGAVVQSQLRRDQRVSSAIVTGTFDEATNTLTLTESIDSLAGKFTLTLSVSQVSVKVLLNGVPLGGG